MSGQHNPTDMQSAQRDMITGSIVVAAIVMFIWTGGSAMSAVVRSLTGIGPGVEQVMMTALLLNIALILFGWRRYRDLQIEVVQRKDAEERARSLAATDPLTGFLNRRSIAEEGAALLARAQRKHKCVALLMLDLDNFKTVNDIHGHAAGDLVLTMAAKRIENLMPPSALTARLGGDEFACAFIFDPNSPEIVDRIAEELVSAMTGPIVEKGIHLAISTSIGIARSDYDCNSVESLMRRADIAMYCAKNQGRNRFAWFDTSMERELNVRNTLEAGMREGIPLGQFIPYYEQQIDLTTGKLNGFEMLARWEHPTQGLISPDIFIPIAEETGLIADLSLSVMRQAFEEAKNWDNSLSLSVNISPAQLKDPWLSQKILKLLVETGFPANRLEVEITESSLFENLSLAQSIVGSLKNQGIRIALDDFGTGYSSLAHLRALPFDRIKIDRSFVSSINQNSESAAIVSAIARLGDSLGLPVTAEGIEDQSIQNQLRDMGCTKGQGWHFGKPMNVEQARKMLAAQNLLPTRISASGSEAPASAELFELHSSKGDTRKAG
ncbi:MAG: EAL domain-containing protein [Alphaproteobacteria bacterium]|nr:EAL domain-containing protein [Alphaproteobacteria bacterium]